MWCISPLERCKLSERSKRSPQTRWKLERLNVHPHWVKKYLVFYVALWVFFVYFRRKWFFRLTLNGTILRSASSTATVSLDSQVVIEIPKILDYVKVTNWDSLSSTAPYLNYTVPTPIQRFVVCFLLKNHFAPQPWSKRQIAGSVGICWPRESLQLQCVWC